MRLHSQTETRRPGTAARGEAGFTILETVIALCVALVVGFGAIGLFLFSASFNAGASDRARALAVAQETMEELRAQSYDTYAAGTTTKTVVRGSSNTNEADKRNFTVVTTIEDDNTTNPVGRQKKITVNVSPEALKGRFSPGAVTVLMLRSSNKIGTN